MSLTKPLELFDLAAVAAGSVDLGAAALDATAPLKAGMARQQPERLKDGAPE
jgi:hypothetical protein